MNRLMILEPDYVNWQQRNELPRFLFETKTCTFVNKREN